MTSSNTDTVTAVDIIEQQNKLEKEALEALPGKFEKCTFNLGYVRQPLYACKTCQENKRNTNASSTTTLCHTQPIASEVGGMCYSCSIACHGDHELYELFPKRHFRCDCGISDKFGQHPCSLYKSTTKKDTINEENTYNHNFTGRYCRCDAIYDPNIEEEAMYQCVTCEDWFHERCIGQIPDNISEFESYVCRSCTKKYPFIYNIDNRFSIGISKNDQPVHKWISSQSADNENEDLHQHKLEISKSEIVHPTPPLPSSSQSFIATDATVSNQNISEQFNIDNMTNNITTTTNISTNESTNKNNVLKRQINEINNDDSSITHDKQHKVSLDKCKNGNYILGEQESMELFLKDGWRDGLCRCEKCLNKYIDHKIEFLLKEEITIEPEEDEDAGKSLLEVGTEQISRLDRATVLESIHAYQLLSNQLKSYFKTFQESGKVVTEKDIRSFFDEKIKKE
ncbi:unnamed protein product [Cunninghamella blakesleeana]